MILISLTLVAAILGSILVWFMICIAVAALMFGDDRAFIIGPVVAASIVLFYWITYLGIVRFVE